MRFQQEDKNIEDKKVIDKIVEKKIEPQYGSFNPKLVDRREIEAILDSGRENYKTNYDHDLEDTLLSSFRNTIDDKMKENEPHYSIVRRNISLFKNNSTVA